MNVVVTGAAGPRGRRLCAALLEAGHAVTGVDTEAGDVEGINFHRLDIRKRGFEELLRKNRPDAIVHLAVHAGFRLDPEERYRLNLEGTQHVLALSAMHDIRKVIVSSHAAVYGALPDNPYFMTEDHPPEVGRTYPEMQDVVTADLLAAAAMGRHFALDIVVLRPVHTLGKGSRDALAVLLRQKRFPTVMGFDPMVQVIHMDDLARAFVAALKPGVRGAFNVTGPGELPLRTMIHTAGVQSLSLPGPIFSLLRMQFGLSNVPAGAVEFLKHPCLVDGTRFRNATGFAPQCGLRETVVRHAD